MPSGFILSVKGPRDFALLGRPSEERVPQTRPLAATVAARLDTASLDAGTRQPARWLQTAAGAVPGNLVISHILRYDLSVIQALCGLRARVPARHRTADIDSRLGPRRHQDLTTVLNKLRGNFSFALHSGRYTNTAPLDEASVPVRANRIGLAQTQ